MASVDLGGSQLFHSDLFNSDNKTLHQVKCHQSALQHLWDERSGHSNNDKTKIGQNCWFDKAKSTAKANWEWRLCTWCCTSGGKDATFSCFTLMLLTSLVALVASLASVRTQLRYFKEGILDYLWPGQLMLTFGFLFLLLPQWLHFCTIMGSW